MIETISKNSPIIRKNNLFYKGDTSLIYRYNDLLYKIYLKRDHYKRDTLDFLLDNYEKVLENGALPPLRKLKYQEKDGIIMNYLEGEDWLDVSRKASPELFIYIIKILSTNLKELNKMGIKLTDLHHHNVLITKDNYPIYIDLDDANVKELGSKHISIKSYNLHSIGKKDYIFENNMIKYGNLDRECLFLMFLDYIFNRALETYTYDDYMEAIDTISDYFSKDLIMALKELKPKEDNISLIQYPYYLGDFLKDEESVIKSLNKIKGV